MSTLRHSDAKRDSTGAATQVAGLVDPVVSVVIPAFNASRTLADTLGSVAAQTYRNLEVVIVDDGSTDQTRSIALDWVARDKRFSLVALAGNQGPSLARREGTERSRGAFIAFIDADDLWSRDHVERHVRALESDSAIGVGFSSCRYIDNDGYPTGESSRRQSRRITAAEFLCANPATTCSTLVVRRNVFDQVGHFRSDMAYAEDQEWLFRVALSKWLVKGIEAQTVSYRRSPYGLSANTEKMEAGWSRFVELARGTAPAIVAKTLPQAAMAMHFYWARQSMMSGEATKVRHHFLSGILSSPAAAMQVPALALFLAGASLSPMCAMTMVRVFRSVRLA